MDMTRCGRRNGQGKRTFAGKEKKKLWAPKDVVGHGNSNTSRIDELNLKIYETRSSK